MTARPHPTDDVVRPLHPFADAWTADQLLHTEFPPPRWAVPDIIPEGLSVLAGPPKVGKSYLVLAISVAVAAGGLALGSITCDPGPVLYLALEDTPRRLQRRLRQVLDGEPPPANLHLPTECPPLRAGGAELIRGWLDHHPGARMVVIDVFAKVRGQVPGGGDSYTEDYAATTIPKRIADDYGVAVILVHHIRKMAADDFIETLSGTNGIAGAADAIHVLKRARGEADGVLHTTGRDVEETERALRLDRRTGTWQLLDGPAIDHTLHTARAQILRHVREHPGIGPKQIADATGIPYELARRTCSRMAASNQLIRSDTGSYTAVPNEWDCTGTGTVPPVPLSQSAPDPGVNQPDPGGTPTGTPVPPVPLEQLRPTPAMPADPKETSR
ncbi:AAA family ATPase [Microlunatus speluncae]|uniref:AAA family ATPase n=1 Tax=Microlunatus speluncae TaxID=2594267 RepID=UPI0012668675|nr:AAA family ATPase [Microlunatus speluncae]